VNITSPRRVDARLSVSRTAPSSEMGSQTIIRHRKVDRFRYGCGRRAHGGHDNATVIVRPDGVPVVTRRSRILSDGREIIGWLSRAFEGTRSTGFFKF
jgi:hypothetical protein